MPDDHNGLIEAPSIVIFEGILAFHEPRVRAPGHEDIRRHRRKHTP